MNVGKIEGPFEGRNGVYIVHLVERQESDAKKLEEDEKKKSEIRSQLLKQKQQKIFDTWYQKVKSEAVIRDFIATAS